MHEIRAPISGVIKSVYKTKGDARQGNRNGPPDSGLPSICASRASWKCSTPARSRSATGADRAGYRRIAASYVLNGHLQEVTCVAVSKGEKPLILSGSEDRTVRVWDPTTGEQKAKLRAQVGRPLGGLHRRQGATPNLALVGCADGSARLFDSATSSRSRNCRASTHARSTAWRSAPTARCAPPAAKITRSACGTPTTGKMLDKPLHAHKSPVTSRAIRHERDLVSAGRDNLLNVWDLTRGKAPVRRPSSTSAPAT